METALDRLREIADALDDAVEAAAVGLISEANQIVARQIVEHERDDESTVYPRLAKFLSDGHNDRLDRVSDAVTIAKRTRGIAVQSIIAGMAMSGTAMCFAAIGLLPPVAGALTQEAIDVAVILNALRALSPGYKFGRQMMPAAIATALRQDHERMESALDRLREIADALDDAAEGAAVALISEANQIVAQQIVEHERDDESTVYPRLAKFLSDGHGLGAMSRAHREIIHLARLLRRLSMGLRPKMPIDT